MDRCSSALSLNNCAVDLLQVGEHQAALQELMRALTEASTGHPLLPIKATGAMERQQQDENGHDSGVIDCIGNENLEHVSTQVVVARDSSDLSPSLSSSSSDTSSTLVPLPGVKAAIVYFTPDNDRHRHGTEQSESALAYCVTATALYNIAVTLHYQGTKTQDQAGPNHLLKAQSFYAKALEILNTLGASCDDFSTCHTLVHILAMSILYNLALSSQQLYQGQGSQFYMESLIFYAASVHTNARPTHPTAAPICQDDLMLLATYKQYCLTNAISFGESTIASAA